MPVLKKNIYHHFIIALLTCSTFFLSAQTPAREYQVKAVFLFNFTQFVDWPAYYFSTDQAPFVIGILGEDPFGTYLEETVSGEKMNGHPIIIQRYQNIDGIKTCHILFVNIPETNKRKAVIASLNGKNILTVSDIPSFLQEGGMIKFYTKNNKIQLQINLEVCKAANMTISSKLLKLAEIFVANKN